VLTEGLNEVGRQVMWRGTCRGTSKDTTPLFIFQAKEGGGPGGKGPGTGAGGDNYPVCLAEIKGTKKLLGPSDGSFLERPHSKMISFRGGRSESFARITLQAAVIRPRKWPQRERVD